jgi:hypothetical protein
MDSIFASFGKLIHSGNCKWCKMVNFDWELERNIEHHNRMISEYIWELSVKKVAKPWSVDESSPRSSLVHRSHDLNIWLFCRQRASFQERRFGRVWFERRDSIFVPYFLKIRDLSAEWNEWEDSKSEDCHSGTSDFFEGAWKLGLFWRVFAAVVPWSFWPCDGWPGAWSWEELQASPRSVPAYPIKDPACEASDASAQHRKQTTKSQMIQKTSNFL